MIDKYEIMLKFIVENDFNGDLTGIKTQEFYDKYLFYKTTLEESSVKDRQAVIRDVCFKYAYKSKQKWKNGIRVCIFEKKVKE